MSLKLHKKCESILFIALCILSVTSKAFGNCQLEITDNISLRPNFLLKIGTRKVDIRLNNKTNIVSLFQSQEIEAYCPNEFDIPFTSKSIIKILCNENDDLFVEDTYINNYNPCILKCSRVWNLYETKENFTWCPSNMTSYLLARPIKEENEEFQYLGGICYDIQNFSFKSLYYTLTPKHSKHLHPKALTYAPSLELQYLKETFSYKSIRASDYGSPDVGNWLNFLQYNYSSVIQNPFALSEFGSDQLASLLDVAWWPSLRSHNWKRYEEALLKHIEDEQESYDIMAGISGVVAVPILESCQTNYTLKKLTDNKYKQVPMYIWNYLSSTKNSSNQIVVIAFNSPFYEFYAEQDVIFCPDKCQQIPWLEKVSPAFRYSTLGIMFCCSVEDVKMSKRLDGFPDLDIIGTLHGTATRKPEAED